MHKFLFIFVALAIAFVACTVSHAADPAEGESVHKGKPVSHWIEALGGADLDTREWAIDALRRIGKPAVPPLIEALKDENTAVQGNAVRTLGEIGSEADTAVPALMQLLESEQGLVNERVQKALIDIGEPAVPALIDKLRGKSERGRRVAAEILSSIGKAAVPALVETFKRQDAQVRRCAVGALGSIGHDAAEAVPAVLE